ncbi:MAG: protein-glutamate O-methyltransferase CheR [Candidatus Scalindua sp.]|jgi:chemotaxis protein methyltransferase CheR|nr:protein-glutamate O-methyltransferase CheR [Candidatus Scalindua sp.]MBT6045496.1 protein-glutamate O-methyltransferase CheR [Candidatus Scalindua sp.]MBT6229416.1 protein-glutamate O-methyltransferase CheR [Candidatus Scalindua sp.]MBT6563936.1 protein-glutamate O-methyltransferase CheR [Candidatus Scalindua sp.]
MQYILSNKEFEMFRGLIYDTCGISLTLSKKELVKSRLTKRLSTLGIDTFSDYYKYVTKSEKTGKELVQLVDSISTNKTDFFREKKHFDFLDTNLLPSLVLSKEKSRNRKLRIWCAAASSGEEPYTLAMTVFNHIKPGDGWDVKILATDISTKVLQKAINGVYDSKLLKDIPPETISSHFSPVLVDKTNCYKAKDHLKDIITFRRFNLMTEKFPFKYPFDFIFCRNVMIYFDPETQHRLVSKFYDCLPKDGHLFIGHSETLSRSNSNFKYVLPAAYRK